MHVLFSFRPLPWRGADCVDDALDGLSHLMCYGAYPSAQMLMGGLIVFCADGVCD